jgi:hypothetical protein
VLIRWLYLIASHGFHKQLMQHVPIFKVSDLEISIYPPHPPPSNSSTDMIKDSDHHCIKELPICEELRKYRYAYTGMLKTPRAQYK